MRRMKVEQIDRHDRHRGSRRYLKRRASKLRRRMGRELLDYAPRKDRFAGWSL